MNNHPIIFNGDTGEAYAKVDPVDSNGLQSLKEAIADKVAELELNPDYVAARDRLKAAQERGVEPGEIPPVGAIVRVVSPRLGRVALVLDHSDPVPGQPNDQFLQVALIDSVPELATDFDLIIDKEESGLMWDLVAQGELQGYVRPSQVTAVWAQVSSDMAVAVRQAVLTDGESLEPYRHGVPLLAYDDLRREHKQSELTDLLEIQGYPEFEDSES